MSEVATRGSSRVTSRVRETLTVFRFEAERRVRVTVAIALVLSLFGGLFLWIAPQVTTGADLDQIADAMPAAMRELFGFQTLNSLEGLLGGEYYSFGWLVGLGGYVAYSVASNVSGDLENDRMDTLLAAPVSRTSALVGKYLSLLVPIVGINVVVPVVLYVGSVFVDDPLPLVDLFALHALAVPFLLCWGAVGLLFGVVVRRGRTAGRAALGVVFAMWLVESLVVGSDFEWVGGVSPMRYFEPSTILVDGTYDLAGAALLLVAATVFVAVSQLVFARADL